MLRDLKLPFIYFYRKKCYLLVYVILIEKLIRMFFQKYSYRNKYLHSKHNKIYIGILVILHYCIRHITAVKIMEKIKGLQMLNIFHFKKKID